MSALSAALAACNRPNVAVLNVVDVPLNNQETLACPSVVPKSPESPYFASSDDSSLRASSSSSSTCSMLSVQTDVQNLSSETRPNEHLAVLMPRHLWKADNLASTCDNFYCKVNFTIFERRHHCRKCGGVFCKVCTSRLTPLLDTSKLSFLHPPHNVSISTFASSESPVVKARVCDDCWDQLYGCPSTPRTPELVRPSLPINLMPKLQLPLSPTDSRASSPSSSSPRTPPNGLGLVVPFERKPTTETSSLKRVSSRCSNSDLRRRTALRGSSMTLPDEERSFGELDSYPLRRSSVLCKATGGGRWEPKQGPVFDGQRVPVPGGKAPYEIRMEKELEEERIRKANPVIKDGEFQYRFPRDPEIALPVRSLSLSTF
ncbi:hypothetical protein E1B28_009773 [Marasmius oreades]|uniref:FYVE-type domain-containing protein n=1 Tax=Marasmius oreades TaxID=181124 RepID=A0A9P7RVY9_9AGAR|nr:uncharacterized protein E1B28_009773 [Marasmius oreades]KAG7090675.1 hypothetical protein E1B28_009773 [Marasmius oreades]